jgi:sulfatase modifying factor 1
MGNNPSLFKHCGDDCPVEQVSWKDCQEFIRKLNQMTSKQFRLPTEAEWEYACRAGTTTSFNTGKCLDADQANYRGDFPMPGCGKGPNRGKTMPVASFKPNAWGLYDMHVNVWEWCQDWYDDYPDGSVTDPVGPSSSGYRIRRGGSWFDFARDCRSAHRYWFTPDTRYDILGFRLALSDQ